MTRLPRNAKLRSAWRQNPRWPTIVMARFWKNTANWKRLLRNIARRSALIPAMADARIDLGTALLAAGDLAGAKEHLQAATKLDPKLAQPHNYLGKVFMGEGNIPSAIARI